MGTLATSGQETRVPAWYLGNLEDYLVRHGHSTGELFLVAGVDPALVAAGATINLEQFTALLRETARLSGNPGFGLAVGSEMTPTSHGALGIAVLSAPTVRDATLTLARYFRTRTPLVMIDALLDLPGPGGEREAAIRVSDAVVLGEAHRPLMELVMSTIVNALRALTFGRFQATEVSFDYPAPAHQPAYEALFRAPLRFGAPVTGVRFPAKFLDAPLPLAARIAARSALEQCQRELEDLDRRTDLRDRVRARLLRHPGDMPDCARVAADLHLSERTLRRRLADLGTSFQAVLAGTRRELAEHFLRDTCMSIGEIAERLGYSDPSNFANAFRQWHGVGPREFRRGRPAGDHDEPGSTDA